LTSAITSLDQKNNNLPLPPGKYFKVSINDNGIGFAQEHGQKIFELFQRLHNQNEYSGTGIGLAICKKIIENHKGYITAESSPDNGATFHIYIPVLKS
jgi:signal transduction histidine kinase